MWNCKIFCFWWLLAFCFLFVFGGTVWCPFLALYTLLFVLQLCCLTLHNFSHSLTSVYEILNFNFSSLDIVSFDELDLTRWIIDENQGWPFPTGGRTCSPVVFDGELHPIALLSFNFSVVCFCILQGCHPHFLWVGPCFFVWDFRLSSLGSCPAR